MKNRVLVVDDDRIGLKLVERAFAPGEVEMAFAVEGGEALAAAAAFRPDLVILDILMPGRMDGYQVCRRLKTDPETGEAMVLLLSGKSSLESRLSGYEALADDYLIKPFDSKELAAKAGILLRLKNAKDELRSVNRNLKALVESKTRELVRKEHQAVIGELMQGLFHNLRGPLAVVQSRAELTAVALKSLSGPPGDRPADAIERAIRNQSLIVEAVGKVESLVENLLEKSRNEASTERRPVDLNDVIRRELEFLESDPAIKRNLDKQFLPADDLPPVEGVYADFSQVVYNLVKNAAEAMADCERRELRIRTFADDGHVYMDFTDTGKGIAPELQDRIFESFFSTKTDRRGKGGGSGLGLYTCRQLMESCGGTITVVNAPEGGCRFTVALPRPG